jgi:hypothetical protein
MRSTRKKKRAMSAENIGLMAEKGKDVSRFFITWRQIMWPH